MIFRVISILTVRHTYLGMLFLKINQCYSRRPKGASGGHEVFASRAAQAAKRACKDMKLKNA